MALKLYLMRVVKLDRAGDGGFIVKMASGDEYRSIAVILAFGKTPERPGCTW